VTKQIRRIEVNFPTPVTLPPGWDETFSSLVNMICEQYEADNPTRTMWPAGHGAKVLWDEPREPGLDPEVYCIDVAEQEASERELQRRGKQAVKASRTTEPKPEEYVPDGPVSIECVGGRHTACSGKLLPTGHPEHLLCCCPCHAKGTAQ
jgi:hypothetical protein